MKSHYFSRHSVDFKHDLAEAVPRDALRALHARQPWRHFAVAARQFAILLAAGYGSIVAEHPLIWVPLAIVQGFTVFNFTVLLHEVVHGAIFARRRPKTERLLGFLYAVPSGISASQFTRWHLDHHAELGSFDDDPKRHHLSPKINARWLKLLYCTPALFPIYFRAARRETATYPPELQRRIAFERWLSIGAHLTVLVLIGSLFGVPAAVRAYVVPVFFVFPVAFTLNRLGQHYDIDPADPAKWGTLVGSHWFWNFAFLNSNLHLEHHYFPGVPFYRLPQLQQLLVPFYTARGVVWQTYGGLLRGWFIENRAPHTNWHAPAGRPANSPGGGRGSRDAAFPTEQLGR